jgi:hypothetical protein
MRSTLVKSFACGGALSLALAMVPAAAAQCGMPTRLIKPMSWQLHSGAPSLMLVSDDNDNSHDQSIVGMWHAVFTAQTMNGGPILDKDGNPTTLVTDNSVVVWHKDGTEIMNSSRPAQDGNFCLGVWERTGDHTYHLNHIPWQGNDPTNAPDGIGNPAGGAQITEDVVLDKDGDGYQGIFTEVAYAPDGTVEVTFTGTIKATRITPHTAFGDLL